MKRLIVIASNSCLTFSAVIAIAVGLYWEPAVQLGRKRHWSAELLMIQAKACPVRKQPLVYWMGDSTLWSLKQKMYPQLISRETEPFLDHCIVQTPGLDYFNYFTMMGPALKFKPDLVVTIANLRMFAPHRDDAVFRDLMPALSASELPRAALLPLYARDLTVPRLLLDRVISMDGVKRVFIFLDGLRAMFQESERWTLLGPRTPSLSVEQQRRRTFRTLMAAYDEELTEGHPVVQMMGATVDMARRSGVKSLVIVVPIPYELLAKDGFYDPLVSWRRIDALRRTVTRNGGCLIDLHATLSPEEFSDIAGHYNRQGAVHLARVVKPVLVDMLLTGNQRCPAL